MKKNAKPGKKQPPRQNKTDKPQPPSIAEQEKKRDKTFPGYPTYPPSEDIMNQGEPTEMDVEKITRSSRLNNKLSREEQPTPDGEENLDVPGADLDNASEAIGEEDEENNFYSLGGDRHENLEEDNATDTEEDQRDEDRS